MARFLFATMPAAGHVAPALPLARHLVERGHAVDWYTGAGYRPRVEATGATHHPITSAYDFSGMGIDEAFPELTGLTGIPMARQAMQRVFIDNAPGMLRDLRTIVADRPVDVVVSETLFVASRWLCEHGGPPWATLGETIFGGYSSDAAPFGPGLFPMRGPLGSLRNRALNAVHRRVLFAPVTHHLEQARRNVGLGPGRRSFLDTLMSPFLFLQGTVPSFEYPRRDLPPQVHFVGPLLPDPVPDFRPPEWWPDLGRSRPVVLVTQGTVATDPRLVIAPTVAALAEREVLVVVAAGGPVRRVRDAIGDPIPENVRLERFIPFGRLLPQVDLMVTNGGYGGLQQALAHGVPLVVSGATEDKPETAARVAWSGVGLRIRAQSPTPERLRAAVERVLAHDAFRDRARAIRDEMAGYDAPARAAELLELLARTGRPVTGREPDLRDAVGARSSMNELARIAGS